jgi:hypothetical protein
MTQIAKKVDQDGVEYIKLKDGYYSTANQRILALKRLYPKSELYTDLKYMTEIQSWHAFTIVRVETEEGAYENTGHSCKAISDPKWGGVAAESAETSSVSRAIAKLGIGIAYSNASYDEVMQSDVQGYEMFDEVKDRSHDIEKELENKINKRKK